MHSVKQGIDIFHKNLQNTYFHLVRKKPGLHINELLRKLIEIPPVFYKLKMNQWMKLSAIIDVIEAIEIGRRLATCLYQYFKKVQRYGLQNGDDGLTQFFKRQSDKIKFMTVYQTQTDKKIQEPLEQLRRLRQKPNIPEKKHFRQLLEPVQDNSCLGCIEFLKSGQQLPKVDQAYSLLAFSYDEWEFYSKLEAKACSLLNCKGGYLLIVGGKNAFIEPITERKLAQHDFLLALQAHIYSKIYPSQFQMYLDYLPVVDKKNESVGFAIRIIFPAAKKQMFFQIKTAPKCPVTYQPKFHIRSEQYVSDDTGTLNQKLNYYDIMHQFYQQDLKSKDYYPIFNKRCFNLDPRRMELIKQEHLVREKDSSSITKFKCNSLVIVAYQNKEKNMAALQKQLEMRKIRHACSFPHESMSKNSVKAIIFVSYDTGFQSLLDAFNAVKKTNPLYFFTVINVELYIQIRQYKQKFAQKYELAFQTKFKRKLQFKTDFVFEQKDNQYLQVITFSYLTVDEAVYSFITFDNERLHPRFCKSV